MAKRMRISIGTEEDFFARGKKIARLADQGREIPETFEITFGDPIDAVRLLTPARIGIFQAVKKEPGSITSIAARLGRDRSAVKRDVDVLEAAGFVVVDVMPNAGHGVHKIVRAKAKQVDVHLTLD